MASYSSQFGLHRNYIALTIWVYHHTLVKNRRAPINIVEAPDSTIIQLCAQELKCGLEFTVSLARENDSPTSSLQFPVPKLAYEAVIRIFVLKNNILINIFKSKLADVATILKYYYLWLHDDHVRRTFCQVSQRKS